MKHSKTGELINGLSRRSFMKSGASAAAAAGCLTIIGKSALPFANPAIQGTIPKVYVCTPCGLPCDKLEFDKPGKCPSCGMALIEKSLADAKPAVAILIFDRAEIIDFAGPWEVFGGAGYKVFTVAEKTEPVNCVYGQRLVADYTFENSPAADVLLVPG